MELTASYADTSLGLTAGHLDCADILPLDEREFRTKLFRLLLQM